MTSSVFPGVLSLPNISAMSARKSSSRASILRIIFIPIKMVSTPPTKKIGQLKHRRIPKIHKKLSFSSTQLWSFSIRGSKWSVFLRNFWIVIALKGLPNHQIDQIAAALSWCRLRVAAGIGSIGQSSL